MAFYISLKNVSKPKGTDAVRRSTWNTLKWNEAMTYINTSNTSGEPERTPQSFKSLIKAMENIKP
jgi:hypothetical protein